MTVTDMTAKGKRQTMISLDGSPAGFLDNREADSLGIEIGVEISAEQWQKVEAETILPRGKRKALELLQLQDRTTKELHDKLIASDYTEKQTWEIIAYVVSFHYIDETRYAYNYIRSHAANKSLREMRRTLVQKGVDEEVVEKAYLQYRDDFQTGKAGGNGEGSEYADSPEEAAVRKFVRKRTHGEPVSGAEKEKLLAALMRKGFSYDAIRSVMNSCIEAE